MIPRWVEIDCDYDKERLLAIWLEHKDNAYVYHNKEANEPQPVKILNLSKLEIPYLKELQSKFKYSATSLFVASSGYHPHIDDRRTCVASFEVINEHGVPLKFYDPDEEANNTNPIIWNTAILHGSEKSPSERVFFQVEMEDDKPFEFYLRKYLEDELFV